MFAIRRPQLTRCVLLAILTAPFAAVYAQAPAAPVRQLGTVKAIDGHTLTLSTAAGASVMVDVGADVPVLQLPPGSTDLKAATPAALGSVAVGDRVLVTARPGDTAASSPLTAARVVLMKSSAITARQSAQQADWQRRGTGGIVKSVDGPVLTVAAGPRMVKVNTAPATIFRRYALDSVKFEDAQPGSLASIRPGDQVSVRGDRSDEGAAIAAEEVVSGTFQNLSGVIASTDPTAGTLTLKDLATKKNVTVKLTANSDLHNLPPETAAKFTARNRPTAAGSAPATAASSATAGAPAPGASAGEARPRSAGMDLSRMLAGLPRLSIADLHVGQAVMIVASQGSGSDLTAITLLSGVEPILSATPSGAQPITLSPWDLGGVPGGGSQ